MNADDTRRAAARPTARWRRFAARHPEYAELYPPAMLAATDDAMTAYEAELAPGAPDELLWAAVEHLVQALNAIDDVHGLFETSEREDLCEYADAALGTVGVDVEALTARRGLERAELTDRWRDW
ncbi:hypothetical protein [Kitasatospora sp. NBC_01539]|uniref:hypothetical protein n=1 Tax=Kitasatospora sp. NBC_01539 TaxID=2903577 RepID=UPI003860273F